MHGSVVLVLKGYPNSVTPDYLPFQTWDTLQGLSTYIRSMLSTQALLGGIGVGETTATVVGATFLWFMRDFTGMLGSILFTLHQGSNLDSSAKQWRLTADLLNDVGMLMDLVSPLFPGAFVTILCIGSMARSVTGVASGATRAALTQHFALRKNAADVSAKEGSQETAATMVGMLLGMVLARLTAENVVALWVSFLLLTAFHMYANYRAVRSLCLTSLNAERTSIVLSAFKEGRKVPTPREVADQEHLLPRIPRLPWQKQRAGDAWLPKSIRFGVQISSLKLDDGWKSFLSLVERYSRDPYLMVPKGAIVHVVLHKLATPQDFLHGYVHALCLADLQLRSPADQSEELAISWMKNNYTAFLDSLGKSGWATDRILVETGEWRAEWITGQKQE
ncbi:protein root UVB sensitive 3 isoform X3 [Physcomitrium patens]|uniref:Uncharacterized protein n=1 Tax=Physcomitrium patens TaxID=3218 RepID=A0A7I4BHV5_PHYPA|nr:protein root UVB sensitive 3-like isoform X3 [Physcomitrium patens]|eukprot:XP_024400463.1 protein root UVB sensitive 3-like isoform X3 [Physcomitrella patens]